MGIDLICMALAGVFLAGISCVASKTTARHTAMWTGRIGRFSSRGTDARRFIDNENPIYQMKRSSNDVATECLVELFALDSSSIMMISKRDVNLFVLY